MKYFGQIPLTIADLEILGPEMKDGLTTQAGALGITQITAAQMQTATAAVEDTDNKFNAARSAQQTANNNFRPTDEALTQWLGKATAAFSTFFGKRWNRQWIQAGFVSPSIAIPPTISDRLALALRVVGFLDANPDKEASTLGVTAAIGSTVREATRSAQELVTDADQEVDKRFDARQAAVDALTSKMRLLIGILAELLNPDDTRWLDFGLEMPAKLTTPAAPTGLSVALAPVGEAHRLLAPNTVMALATCNASPGTTRYRFRMRIVGVLGSTFQLVGSSTEPMLQVAVPANATVEFIAQAVNGNRQSVASEPFIFTPTPVTSRSASVPATAPSTTVETPGITSGNGSNNGQANGNRLPAIS